MSPSRNTPEADAAAESKGSPKHGSGGGTPRWIRFRDLPGWYQASYVFGCAVLLGVWGLTAWAIKTPHPAFITADLVVERLEVQLGDDPPASLLSRKLPVRGVEWKDVGVVPWEDGAAESTVGWIDVEARDVMPVDLRPAPGTRLALQRELYDRLWIQLVPPRGDPQSGSEVPRSELASTLSTTWVGCARVGPLDLPRGWPRPSSEACGLPERGLLPVELVTVGSAASVYVDLALPARTPSELVVVDPSRVDSPDLVRKVQVYLPEGELQPGQDKLVLLNREPTGIEVLNATPFSVAQVQLFKGGEPLPESFVLGGTIRFPNGEEDPLDIRPRALVKLDGDLVLRRVALSETGKLELSLEGYARELGVGFGVVENALPSELEARYRDTALTGWLAGGLLVITVAVVGYLMNSHREFTLEPPEA